MLISGTGSADVLRQAQVPILNNTQCSGWYGSNFTEGITPGMMCAGYQFGGIDSCQVNSIALPKEPFIFVDDLRLGQ